MGEQRSQTPCQNMSDLRTHLFEALSPLQVVNEFSTLGILNTLSVFKGNLVFILHTWKPLLLTTQSSSTLGIGSNGEAANWPFGQL